jgi:hypothetical protein
VFDTKSIETAEIKPVDPVWTCTYLGATFQPPADVTPTLQNPGNPNVSDVIKTSSHSDDNASWTTKVSSPNPGQWELKFKVAVKYSKRSKTTGQNIPNEIFGPFEGENTFSFFAINKLWKVNLSPNDNVVCRHSTKPAKRPVVKVKASLTNADGDKTVIISSSNTGGQVKFGAAANNAINSTLEITIPKNGTTTFYISGEKESIKTNDVLITATSFEILPPTVSSTNVTVLWVNVKANKDGVISKNNSQREDILRIRNNESALGKDVVVYEDPSDNKKFHVHFKFVIEAEGSVLPQDFTSNLVIRRDAAVVKKTSKQMLMLLKRNLSISWVLLQKNNPIRICIPMIQALIYLEMILRHKFMIMMNPD